MTIVEIALLAQTETIKLGPLPKPGGTGDNTVVMRAFYTVIGVVASVSLLIITIAALKYATSRGDAQAVAQAKNAIIYALVGLVVCMVAFAIVTFVVNGI